MTARIEDYAMIGDCETGALVSRGGSIDWLCWPRFDSGACFAALLGNGDRDHGRWLVAPADADARVKRNYRDGTLILETHFETTEGAVTLIDFMPPRDESSEIVRLVVGERGRVKMRTELVLRFDYGATVPWVSRVDGGALRAVAGPDMVVLRTDVELRGEGLTTVGDFTVGTGDTAWFTLSYGRSYDPLPRVIDPRAALEASETFWREWIARCTYTGQWTEAVRRSVVTLKGLTYRPTGGVVAALTTSLPECIGGQRNWDYRYCWLRDATLTLLALVDAGFHEEAAAWRDWLLRAAAGSPSQLQIMYGIAGERHLLEWEVSWLPGFESSRPVRVGNAAAQQLQLDVYGEVMDALFHARREGQAPGAEAWRLELALVEHLEKIAHHPDHGMWEVRGPAAHFTHSKVMAWVAMDRAVKSAEQFGLDAPLDRWRAWRDALHAEICEKAFDARLGSFVQSYGSRHLDASVLLMPLVGFLPPEDERIRGTVRAIEQRLMSNGLVYRYDTAETDDGLPAGEGAFLACTFWLVDNLALVGRKTDARRLFERLLALRNDVGLLAEEYDPVTRRQLGNMPQAFSHLALLGSALNLSPRRAQTGQRPARQRAESGREK